MKKVILILITLLLSFFIAGCDVDYGNSLPPEFPKDVPVVEGKITSSKKTTFEDGEGYVVDVDTEQPFQNVVDFYSQKFNETSFRTVSGQEQNMVSADFNVGEKLIFLEIVDQGDLTHVTIAVHLTPTQ